MDPIVDTVIAIETSDDLPSISKRCDPSRNCSAMTVWTASQPMRGQLLEKSIFRIVGTIFGASLRLVRWAETRGNKEQVIEGGFAVLPSAVRSFIWMSCSDNQGWNPGPV